MFTQPPHINEFRPCPKIHPVRDQKYLDWLLTQPPVRGFPTDVYSHQRLKLPCSVKGTGQKEHDIYALPVSNIFHDAEGHGTETAWDIDEMEKMKIILEHLLRYRPELVPVLIEFITKNWRTEK